MAVFQAVCAAVANVIFPVNTPTTISLVVSAPEAANTCNALAFSAADNIFTVADNPLTALDVVVKILYPLNAAKAAVDAAASKSK